MAKNGDTKSPGNSGSTLGYEANLWTTADKMRGHMDASEYKHVCLGLIFLKYISEAFDEKREQPFYADSFHAYLYPEPAFLKSPAEIYTDREGVARL